MMSISREEALGALGELERVEARAFENRVYRAAGGQLILWGAIWAVGYTASGLYPDRAELVWALLLMTGVVAGLLLARRSGELREARAAYGWRWAAQAAAFTAFLFATYVVFPISSPAQPATFPALAIAFTYALVGSWRFTRLLWIGAALFVLTIGGFVLLKPIIIFWLAAVGGGALILGGVWLRSA